MNTTSSTCRNRTGSTQKRTRIVLGLGPTLFAANVAHQFRTRGWDVLTTATGEDARRAVVGQCATAAVVPYAGNDPLVTAKIVNAVPRRTKVVLLCGEMDVRARQFAEMMGVPVVTEAGGPEAVWAAVANATSGVS